MSINYQRYDKKITAYFTVIDYDRFVYDYNNIIDASADALSKDGYKPTYMTPIEEQVIKDGKVVVDNTDLFENEGNPSKYKNADIYKNYAIRSTENLNGHGTALTIGEKIMFETSNSFEKQYGTHFNYEHSNGTGLSIK